MGFMVEIIGDMDDWLVVWLFNQLYFTMKNWDK
jgi:hypothetical protein